MEKYQKEHEDKDKPKVLILMGLPGSYIIATENSYVGSLVELAGGENVYAGTDQEFFKRQYRGHEDEGAWTLSFVLPMRCRIR